MSDPEPPSNAPTELLGELAAAVIGDRCRVMRRSCRGLGGARRVLSQTAVRCRRLGNRRCGGIGCGFRCRFSDGRVGEGGRIGYMCKTVAAIVFAIDDQLIT